MGTREVYEQKLRSGNLYHEPTMNPGLGSARCPRCFALVNPESAAGDWTITTVLHDATAVAGSGAGGMLSAIHGLNKGMPFIQNRVKGPMWLHLVLGLPPVLLYSAAGAVLGGYALPRFAQCCVTSYYAASSASHYAISQITRRVEGVESSSQHEKRT